MSAFADRLRGGMPSLPFRRRKKAKRRPAQMPIEYSMIQTAVLCLVAFGIVMVFSASSTTSLLGESGDGAYFFKRTLLVGAIGLLVMQMLSRRGLALLRPITPLLLGGTIVALMLVLIPGIGVEGGGARRWLGSQSLQVQPSELAKLTLILYGAHILAVRPSSVRRLDGLMPYLLMTGLVCMLIIVEPDLGSALIAAFAVAAMLIAAGVPFRYLAMIGGALFFIGLIAIAMEPYRQERLFSFLNPGADPAGAGFQSNQASIALGSGGLFGVGLGESVQKAFYLPESHTDMIAAVIGEEVGLIGLAIVIGLFGMFGLGGLMAAKNARTRYASLLAAGLTTLILLQAAINLAAVMGMAPLTGVTLPFVSYGNSSLLVSLASVGLILNVARGGTASAGRDGRGGARLKVIEGGLTSPAEQASRRTKPTAKPKSRAKAKAKPRTGGAKGRRKPAASRSSQNRKARPTRTRRAPKRNTTAKPKRASAPRGDSRRRDGGSRRAGAGRSRRAR